MKKSCFSIALVLIGTIFFIACNNNDDAVKSPKNPVFQSDNPLAGTVWVHHPDTDPESANWFNLEHSPIHQKFTTDAPAEICFLDDGRIDANVAEKSQFYHYSYNDGFITVVMHSPGDDSDLSVSEFQVKYNLCPLTVDNPICGPNCVQTYLNLDFNPGAICLLAYRFLGKVDGDDMYLKEI